MLRAETIMNPNPIPKKRQRAELVSPIIKQPAAMPGAKERAAQQQRANPPAQQRMEAKQAAESGANHARHHAPRKGQS
jgi:hypothetical protein